MQGVYLILFDCDGTLVDSQHMIIEAMEQAFRGEGLEPPAPDDVRRIVGLSLHDAVEVLVPKEQLNGKTNRLVDSYKSAFADLRLAQCPPNAKRADVQPDGSCFVLHLLSKTLLDVFDCFYFWFQYSSHAIFSRVE